jgi:hypothetical protein
MGTSKKEKSFPPQGPSSSPPRNPPPLLPPPLQLSFPFPPPPTPLNLCQLKNPLPPPFPRDQLSSCHLLPLDPPPPPPPTIERILTRNKSERSQSPSDPPRKAGRKSNKELRDETAAKEMATGAQQPMDSYLGQAKRKWRKNKGEERDSPKNLVNDELVSWNCRGMGSSLKTNAVRD